MGLGLPEITRSFSSIIFAKYCKVAHTGCANQERLIKNNMRPNTFRGITYGKQYVDMQIGYGSISWSDNLRTFDINSCESCF